MAMFSTPILLITFNRPEHTRRVLERVLEAKPQNLYVFQDGAREGNERDRQKCAEVRQVIEELWGKYISNHSTAAQGGEVTLHRYYSDTNLGCGPGPYTAISWFFTEEEYGIVLEDDLDPHPLFFEYMEDLLVRYRDERLVGLITAHNQHRIYTGKSTYYFTYNMSGTLGWGTWKRVWKYFDFNIAYNQDDFDTALKNNYNLPKPYRDYENHFYAKWLTGSRNDVWDHQFKYYLLMNGYLDAKPNSCLVSHLGNDSEATHTGFDDPNYLMDIHENLFNPMQHPSVIRVDDYETRRAWIKAIKIIVKRVFKLIDY